MSRADRLWWVTVGGLTATGLALRAFHMTGQNLWLDEIDTLRVATTPLGDVVRGVAGGSDLPPTTWLSPLYYLVLKAFLLAAHGSPEWTLRLSSVLLGAAAIPALAWTATRLAPARVALTAAAILAVSPFHVWYSQEVRPYVLLVLAATLAVGCWRRALETNRTGTWLGFVACTVAALYTHPIALTLPLFCALTLVLGARARPEVLRRGLATLVVVGLLFVPALALVRMKGMNYPADVRGVSPLDVPYALYAFSVGYSLGPTTTELHGQAGSVLPTYAPLVVALAALFGTVLLAGLAQVLHASPTDRVLLALWLVVPIVVALVAAMASANPFNVRYAIVAYPAFVILIASGVWRLAEVGVRLASTRIAGARLASDRAGHAPSARAAGSARRATIGTAATVASLLIAVSAWSLDNLYFDPRYAKEACGALGALLHAETTAEDLVLVNVSYMASAVRYYYPGPAEVIGYPRQEEPPDAERLSAELAGLTAGRAHVWLVLTRTFHGDRAGVLRALLAAQLEQDRERRFPGVVAYRFSRRGTHVAANGERGP